MPASPAPAWCCSMWRSQPGVHPPPALQNPWLSLEGQLAGRRSAGRDGPGRAKTPWVAVGGGHRWAWGVAAMEGLTLEPAMAPPHPPAPVPPFNPQAHPWAGGALGWQ